MKLKYWGTISILLLYMLFLTGCNTNTDDAKVIAEINGQALTKIQLDERIAVIKNMVEEQQGVKLDAEKDQELIEQINETGYQNLIIMALIEDYAVKNDIQVDDETVKTNLQNLQNQKNQQEQNGYQNYLKNVNMTEKQLKEELRKEKLVELVYNKVTADVMVSNEEIEQFYKNNITYFTTPAGMQIAHILVESEELANNILERAKKGEDFKTLAQEFSTCPSKNQGGDLGTINQDSNFVPEFKKAALALKAGEITAQPVKTEFGYHIIKAGSMQPAKVSPLDEVANNIKAQLLKDKQDSKFSEFIDNLKSTAEIKDLRANEQ